MIAAVAPRRPAPFAHGRETFSFSSRLIGSARRRPQIRVSRSSYRRETHAPIKRHLTYANVAATLALVIAVAGGTTAIAGSKAAKNTVASSSIKPYNVTAGIWRDSDSSGHWLGSMLLRLAPRASVSLAVEAVTGGRAWASSRPGNNGWFVEQGTGPGDRLIVAYALCLKAKPGK